MKYHKIEQLTVFLAFLAMGTLTANAQDVMTLNDGNEIRARVIEISSTEIRYKLFENLDGPTIAISRNEVFAINYENGEREIIHSATDSANPSERREPLDPTIHRQHIAPGGRGKGFRPGFKGIIEYGYQYGIGDYPQNRYVLNLILGRQMNSHFSWGIGAGLRLHTFWSLNEKNPNDWYLYVPVFADFRINFSDRRFTPFFSMSAGYALHDDYGGVFLSPQIGVSRVTRYGLKNNAMHFGIGFDRQRRDYDVDLPEPILLDAISLIFSISF